jgi:hypothetical protein
MNSLRMNMHDEKLKDFYVFFFLHLSTFAQWVSIWLSRSLDKSDASLQDVFAATDRQCCAQVHTPSITVFSS